MVTLLARMGNPMVKTLSLAVLWTSLTATGCGGDGNGTATSANWWESCAAAGVVFQDRSAGATDVQGLYLGQSEVVAYDYRPGEAVQSGQDYGKNIDWSFWVVLPAKGHNALKPQGKLFTALGAGDPPSQEFIDQVGRLEIDILEIYLYRTGVIVDGKYYGMNADMNGFDKHPLFRYPEWEAIPDTYTQPQFPGPAPAQWQSQGITVLYARRDWFPEAVHVHMQDPDTIVSSVPALTADQTAKVQSLVKNSTRSRSYDHLLLVPFDTVAVPLQCPAPKLQVTVWFDLTDVLDAATMLGVIPPVVAYTGDANDVPFGGLAVTIQL